jgi:hypothetical protein
MNLIVKFHYLSLTVDGWIDHDVFINTVPTSVLIDVKWYELIITVEHQKRSSHVPSYDTVVVWLSL